MLLDYLSGYMNRCFWDWQNILLCHADEDTECKVADFGLSKLFPEDARDLQTQTLCGTPG